MKLYLIKKYLARKQLNRQSITFKLDQEFLTRIVYVSLHNLTSTENALTKCNFSHARTKYTCLAKLFEFPTIPIHDFVYSPYCGSLLP